ncbi:hypothetical protein AABD59_06280 [Edwardsiella piscicida]|uniref:hypothetical protein n=1 Tax=Edwardsiella piscicida TaxID=1263550 RepID=UPI00370D9E2C
MLLHFAGALLLIIITLAIGVAGHLLFDDAIAWHDATLNSAFIANGIGPYIVPQSLAGKIFFAFYGMFTSLVFMTTLGLIWRRWLTVFCISFIWMMSGRINPGLAQRGRFTPAPVSGSRTYVLWGNDAAGRRAAAVPRRFTRSPAWPL